MKIKRFNESNTRIKPSIDLSLSKDEIVSLVNNILTDRDEFSDETDDILNNLTDEQASKILDLYLKCLFNQIKDVSIIDFNSQIYDLLKSL